MLDNMIIMFSQSIVGWVVLGMIGLVATIFAVYYILFAIYLIVASVYSGIKLLPESYRIWRSEAAATYDPAWGRVELGLTMPDGGEPVEKKEEKEKEKEKEKET